MTRVKRRVFGEKFTAYAVMAVGVLMLAVGLYATVTGSQIVQVEAGWTSVISGSILIAGGVVTVTLGLLMRVILGLKAALQGQIAAPIPDAAPQDRAIEQPVAEIEEASENRDAPTSGDTPVEEPVPTPELKLPEPSWPPFRGSLSTPEKATDETVSLGLPTGAGAHQDDPPSVALTDQPLSADLRGSHEDAEEQALAATTAHPADDYKLETPSTAEHDLAPAEPPKEANESKNAVEADWLDRALAALDKEIPLSSAPVSQPISSDRSLKPAVEQKLPKVEPLRSEKKQEENSVAKTDSAIIGRYEADGTSYVMYADGSIEAQSEAGVYRFSSMAELKAHIEG